MFNNNQEFEYFTMSLWDEKYNNAVVYKNRETFEDDFIRTYFGRLVYIFNKGMSLANWNMSFEENLQHLDSEEINKIGITKYMEKTCNNSVYPMLVFKIPKQYLIDKSYSGYIDEPLPLLYPRDEVINNKKTGRNIFSVRPCLIDGVYSKAFKNDYIKNPNYSPVFNPAGGVFSQRQLQYIREKCIDKDMVSKLFESRVTDPMLVFAHFDFDNVYTTLQEKENNNGRWNDIVSKYSQIYGPIKEPIEVSKEKIFYSFKDTFENEVLGEILKFDKSNYQVDFSFDGFAKSLNDNHPLQPVLINNEWVVKNNLTGRYAVENQNLLLQQRFADIFKRSIKNVPERFRSEYGSMVDSIENNRSNEDNRLRVIYDALLSTFGNAFKGDDRVNHKYKYADLRTPSGQAIMQMNMATNNDPECNFVIQQLINTEDNRKVIYDFAGASVKANYSQSRLSGK